MSQSDTAPVLLTMAQVRQGAELLAQVFQYDPSMAYVLGDSGRILEKMTRLYGAVIRSGVLYGQVYTTPSVDGVAIWFRLSSTDSVFRQMIQMLRSGVLPAMLSLGVKPLLRIANLIRYLGALRKQAASGSSYWELAILGIEAGQQGKGIGGSLIQPMLARADAENVTCYLESSNERNLTFYQRHGFKIAAEGRIPQGGPPIWIMRREPVGQQAATD